MNNDINKYRVWDVLGKKYCTEKVYITPDGKAHIGDCLLEPEYFSIERCTGLRDKNGKLIYEGDVVRFPDGFGGEVAWWDGLWIYDRIGLSPLTKHIDGIEVVGNIHEEGK